MKEKLEAIPTAETREEKPNFRRGIEEIRESIEGLFHIPVGRLTSLLLFLTSLSNLPDLAHASPAIQEKPSSPSIEIKIKNTEVRLFPTLKQALENSANTSLIPPDEWEPNLKTLVLNKEEIPSMPGLQVLDEDHLIKNKAELKQWVMNQLHDPAILTAAGLKSSELNQASDLQLIKVMLAIVNLNFTYNDDLYDREQKNQGLTDQLIAHILQLIKQKESEGSLESEIAQAYPTLYQEIEQKDHSFKNDPDDQLVSLLKQSTDPKLQRMGKEVEVLRSQYQTLLKEDMRLDTLHLDEIAEHKNNTAVFCRHITRFFKQLLPIFKEEFPEKLQNIYFEPMIDDSLDHEFGGLYFVTSGKKANLALFDPTSTQVLFRHRAVVRNGKVIRPAYTEEKSDSSQMNLITGLPDNHDLSSRTLAYIENLFTQENEQDEKISELALESLLKQNPSPRAVGCYIIQAKNSARPPKPLIMRLAHYFSSLPENEQVTLEKEIPHIREKILNIYTELLEDKDNPARPSDWQERVLLAQHTLKQLSK